MCLKAQKEEMDTYQVIMGQNFISDGAKFLISFFTSKMDGVYPGSHKNTFFSKKF